MDGMKIDESLIPKIIGIVVAVIVVAVALIPITEEAAATTTTFENDGYYRMNYYDTDTPVTFSWSYDKPNVFITNDVEYEVNLTSIPPSTCTIIGDTNWMIRCQFGSDGIVSQLNYVGSSGAIIRAQVSDQATVNLTMENGLMNGTVGTTTISDKAYDQLYVIDKDGSYVMKNATTSAYMKSDSEFFAYGNTIINSAYLGLEISGNIEDGANVVIWRGESGFTTDEPTLHYTTNSNYIDLYELSTITLNATRISDEVVTPITYSYFVVPYEVTAEKAVHPDAMTNTIISTIPIFVALAILMGIVGLMYFNRNGQ